MRRYQSGAITYADAERWKNKYKSNEDPECRIHSHNTIMLLALAKNKPQKQPPIAYSNSNGLALLVNDHNESDTPPPTRES
eukprot:scaffold33263_cov70-Cyclotella_meneghiniana.AAC.10